MVAVGAVIVWLWVCGGYKRWSRSARTNARAAQRRGRGTGTTATRPTLHILSGRHALYLAHQFSRHAGTHPSSPAHLDQYIAAHCHAHPCTTHPRGDWSNPLSLLTLTLTLTLTRHHAPTGRPEQPSKPANPSPDPNSNPNPNQASRTHAATGATPSLAHLTSSLSQTLALAPTGITHMHTRGYRSSPQSLRSPESSLRSPESSRRSEDAYLSDKVRP